MSVKRLTNLRQQYFDSNGLLASGYRLFFYTAGSSTKQNTYNSSTGSVANANPMTLNALGEPAGEIWLTAGVSYKVGIAIPGSDDPPASFVWTEDVVTGVNDATLTVDQWLAGPAPTYISGTSFSMAGDQTSAFHVGRRVKTTNTSGTVYSSISASSFGAGITTVTVINDSTTLDSGLSAVYYGILSASNTSLPVLSTLTASLGSDVSLNNTANYFDGPSIAQGTAGKWWVSGSVVVQDTAGGAAFSLKLWDGTTVIDSRYVDTSAINLHAPITLSGYITSPAGNLRISAKDGTSTSGKINFNISGNSKDSTISAVRIG